ncbi:MAG: hypothetical protein HDT28_08920 [Clostridiales bacterium]|nr:hypothetical protein [Clostridiales bacterium]
MTNSTHAFSDLDDEPIIPPPPDDEPISTAVFRTLPDALAAAAPPESTVRTIGFDNVDELLRAGYRVNRDDEHAPDVIIARGGLIEFGIAQARQCKKLILVPTHDFAAVCSPLYRATDGAFAVVKRGRKPFAAVLNPENIDDNLAAVFGEIVALDLAAFDLSFGAHMRGDEVDTALNADVSSLVTSLTAELKPIAKNRTAAAQALMRAGEKCAHIVERRPELLFASGATQTAEALRMLCTAEERIHGMRGELETVLGAILIDFYIKNRTSTRFEFPPNNGKRIDSICEFFRVDVRHACIHTTPIYPPVKMRLCEYRRHEFGKEQARMLVELKTRHARAMQVFKRLYPDDGFGLKTLVDPTDVGLCLALAPDVFAADSMLSFLKQAGKLEKYII